MINTEELKAFVYDVIGAMHETHRELGAGLNESCYQEGFEMELAERGIAYRRELPFHPTYHGKVMKAKFLVDFLCKDGIIVECKAVTELLPDHRAQLFNYMHILKVPCGILVNFKPKFAIIERYFYDKDLDEIVTVDGKSLAL